MSLDTDSGPRPHLVALRDALQGMWDDLALTASPELESWRRALESRLLTPLAPDAPLVVAICGGGSAGKSTLFNHLAGTCLSPVGGRAGINRRVLVGLHPTLRERAAQWLPALHPDAAAFEPYAGPNGLTVAGPPQLAVSTQLPPRVVLLDTPDFDTGAAGAYANREATARALEAADVLIYIFTNATYSNRDNTDFITTVLTGIGRRRCMLVYRAYPSFSADEVREHAMTVAGNIYGQDAQRYLLGIWRADESNAVAAGSAPPSLRPLAGDGIDLITALTRLDPQPLRLELLRSVLADILKQAQRFADEGQRQREALLEYARRLRAAEACAARGALHRFPADAVMRRFVSLWLATDPPHVRAMRATGRVLDLPVRALIAVARRAGAAPPSPAGSRQTEEAARMAADLAAAATRLRLEAAAQILGASADAFTPPHAASDPGLAMIGDAPAPQATDLAPIAAPAAVRAAQQRMAQADWPACLETLQRRGAEIFLASGIDAELRDLVDRFRHGMGLWDQVRQTFSALLNVLPATAAVTYILATGDPVGAAGLKVKLAGLFGLHDLYALVALPATSGLKQADRAQIDALLGPVAQAWLASKLQALRDLLHESISGPVLQAADQAAAHAGQRQAIIAQALAACRQEPAA
jgi:hypothetical protein